MRIGVFGANGMLGRAVVAEAADRSASHSDVLAFDRSVDIGDREQVAEALRAMPSPEVVVNCAGVIPPAVGKPHQGDIGVAMVRANALGPQVIVEEAIRAGVPRVIHVSTDCVFSGRMEPQREFYDVGDAPDPVDLYGRSKLVGECLFERAAAGSGTVVSVVRTSFVGTDHGLLRWLLTEGSQGRSVQGWRNAWWSGSTVYAVARELVKIAENTAIPGILHLATALPITKAKLLSDARDAFGLRVTITEVESPKIRRVLWPTVELPPFIDSLSELVNRWHDSREAP